MILYVEIEENYRKNNGYVHINSYIGNVPSKTISPNCGILYELSISRRVVSTMIVCKNLLL